MPRELNPESGPMISIDLDVIYSSGTKFLPRETRPPFPGRRWSHDPRARLSPIVLFDTTDVTDRVVLFICLVILLSED